MNPSSLTRKRSSIGLLTSVAIFAIAFGIPFAHGQISLLNSSFEDVDPLGRTPSYGLPIWDYATADSIGGWVVNGKVELIGNYWQAADGVQSLCLTSGGVGGAVSQQVATQAGKEYHVTFAYSGSPDGGSGINSQVSMTWNGSTIGSSNFNSSDSSHGNMDWQYSTFDVYATGTTSTLGFINTSSPASAYMFGSVIDNVSISAVSAVPEPSTYAAILGFVSMGFVMVRRRFVRK